MTISPLNGGMGATGLGTLAATPLTGNAMGRDRAAPGTWFEALSRAWGNSLDNQAARIEQASDMIAGQGMDNPSVVTKLTTESLRMSFMANSSSSSIDSVGKALETMARKG